MRQRWTAIVSCLAISTIILLVVDLPSGGVWAQARPSVAGNALPERSAPPVEAMPADLTGRGEGGEGPEAGRVGGMGHGLPPVAMSDEQHAAFAEALDLEAFRQLSVFHDGRAKILDTLAREYIGSIYGKPRFKDLTADRRFDPVFTYLDLMFNKAWYGDKPLVHVEVLPLREAMLAHLPPEPREQWKKWGRLSPRMFLDPQVRAALAGSDRDLRLSKGTNQVMGALWRLQEGSRELAMISPLAGHEDWIDMRSLAATVSLDDADAALAAASGAHPGKTRGEIDPHAGHGHAAVGEPASAENVGVGPASGGHGSGGSGSGSSAGGDSMSGDRHVIAYSADEVANVEAARTAAALWQQMSAAWRVGDAETVNLAASELVSLIPTINPQTYPPGWLRWSEYVYNLTGKFAVAWVVYLLAALCLGLAAATGRRWLYVTGSGLLLTGFALHTAAMLVRGMLTGRWPIHNQFESFVAIGFFAVLAGILFMLINRQAAVGAAAGVLGGVVFLSTVLFDIPSHEAGMVAGILATSGILYVHVNIVLISYSLIALAFVISLGYLAAHYFYEPARASLQAVERAAAVGGGGAVLAGAGGPAMVEGRGSDAAAGASAKPGRARLLHDLDRSQLLVMQLAFWLLGVGILLGAYWADHAWGRWWAWDPKETWALITWIIYLIAIHARLGLGGPGTPSRGLVTAWLSVIGFVAMLWCYWGVNLLLAGLHSYA